MSTSPSRFSFILKSDNSELDQTVSTLFSYISESAIKDDIPKLVREHLTKIWGSGWCVFSGVAIDKAIRYYKGFCCMVYDAQRKEEIVIFRPSSMPITEKMEDKDDVEEEEKMDVKVNFNKMDDSIFDYTCRCINFMYTKSKVISAFELRRLLTIGCGPLFHVISSTKRISWAFDEQADQLLSFTIQGNTYIVWRMMLDTKVFAEKTDVSVIDKSWLKTLLLLVLAAVGVMLFFKYKACDDLNANNLEDGFFDDELEECLAERRNLAYITVGVFALFVLLRRVQKNRREKRRKGEKKYFNEAFTYNKKNN